MASIPGHSGLTQAEAEVRLQRHGPNSLPGGTRRTWRHIAFDAAPEPMFLLPAGGGLLYPVLGDLLEGAFLFAMVLVTIGMTLYQQGKTERRRARTYSRAGSRPSKRWERRRSCALTRPAPLPKTACAYARCLRTGRCVRSTARRSATTGTTWRATPSWPVRRRRSTRWKRHCMSFLCRARLGLLSGRSGPAGRPFQFDRAGGAPGTPDLSEHAEVDELHPGRARICRRHGAGAGAAWLAGAAIPDAHRFPRADDRSRLRALCPWTRPISALHSVSGWQASHGSRHSNCCALGKAGPPCPISAPMSATQPL